MIKNLKAIFNPDRYHGWGKKERFFEGWYFKNVDQKGDQTYAIIPGIAMDEHGKKQAFIQVLDGKNRKAAYHKYDFSSFKADADRFKIQIENNHFSRDKMVLDLPDLKGELTFSNRIPWPKTWYSPGIMGPFSFVPFMQCYHGIVSMDHDIQGTLQFRDKAIDFTAGKGYLEKDWGHSFPSAYIWMQSNHFSKPGISLKASVAKIPWLGSSFVGFIAGLLIDGEVIRFTTYNGTRLVQSSINIKSVILTMENRKYRLEITAKRDSGTELAAPISGFMDARINESMTANLAVKLINKKEDKVILTDHGVHAGLEIAGNIEEIVI